MDPLVFSIHVDLVSHYDLEDLRRALEDARALLQGSEGPGDAACCTRIDAIDLEVFGTPGDGLDVIDSQAKSDQVLSMNALVLDISWPDPSCGRAVLGGSGMIVALDCTFAGATIAHERGHNVGLGHRFDDSCQPTMGFSRGSCLNAAECNLFRARGTMDGVCTCLDSSIGGPPAADGVACSLDAEAGVCRAGGVCVEGAVWQTAKLLASDGAADDSLGFSVAVAGDTALVGAEHDDDDGLASGSAYVFRFDGKTWAEEAKLTASDGTAGDEFGGAVAIDGVRALVGAWSDDDNGLDSGSAYVFLFDGTDWVEEAKLTASDGAATDFFGDRNVDLSADTAVVGAWQDDDDGLDSGSAYVFRFDGTAWVEEAKLTASDGAAGDWFGFPVVVSGDTVLVGATGDDDEGLESGSVYVFRFDGTAWVEAAKLVASDGAADDWFGFSVAVDRNTAAVGTYRDDDHGSDSGSAYVFRDNGTAWVEEAKLTASDGAIGDSFGYTVAVSGDTVVVGADLDDDYGANSGSAYVFRYDGTAWIEQPKLAALDAAGRDFFSGSVAVDGKTVVVGANGADDNGSASGAAYVFAVAEPAAQGLHAIAIAALAGLARCARRRR